MRALFPSLLTFLVACGGGADPASLQAKVDEALAAKDWPAAVTRAEEALANATVSGDPATAWRFESLRLDALADGGKGDDAASTLARLSEAYPKQATAAVYRAVADKLRVAGDGTGAATVLDAGVKRFPSERAAFEADIAALANAGGEGVTDMLKQLGYLGN